MTFNQPIEKKPIHDGVIFRNKNTGEKFAVIQIIPTNDLEIKHFIKKLSSKDVEFLFRLFMTGYSETRNKKDGANRYNIIVYNYKHDAMYLDSEKSLEIEYENSSYEQIDVI